MLLNKILNVLRTLLYFMNYCFVGGTAVLEGREAGGAGEGRGGSLARQEEGQGGRFQGILC